MHDIDRSVFSSPPLWLWTVMILITVACFWACAYAVIGVTRVLRVTKGAEGSIAHARWLGVGVYLIVGFFSVVVLFFIAQQALFRFSSATVKEEELVMFNYVGFEIGRVRPKEISFMEIVRDGNRTGYLAVTSSDGRRWFSVRTSDFQPLVAFKDRIRPKD